MSGESSNAPAVATDAAQPPATVKDDAPVTAAESKETAPTADSKPAADSEEPATAPATTAAAETEDSDKPTEESSAKASEPPAEKSDVEMTDSAAPVEASAADGDANTAAAPTDATAPTPNKSKANAKRKSIGGGTPAKKLNKKASKARILHIDAQPGEHYFVKLKGFPQWPVIICDEDMLPTQLLKSRPVTAKRADGTYRDDYADGAKKVGDRTFPVMYLYTNEFGWVPNCDLIDLDPTTVKDAKTEKMRKDLQAAHDLAAENHDLSYYKDVLQQYQDDLLEQEKARLAKAVALKGKKTKATVDEDEDAEMPDADEEEESSPPKEKKSAKKRKAEEPAETPQKTDSVKKPKIKLTTNSTPKTNGAQAAAAKPAKAASEGKATKAKAKKPKETEEKKAEKEPVTPKEPELTPEEKRARKEKEVLFLRHKLQKGLLTRDQEPKEEEMKLMSDYVTKLEALPDLEVSIIRTTKINKVLKAILKLDNIPKEEEFKFKPRSQALLDTWNKLLAAEPAPAEGANGVNGTKETAKTNGVKAKTEVATSKEETKEEGKESAKADEKATEETKAPEATETSA